MNRPSRHSAFSCNRSSSTVPGRGRSGGFTLIELLTVVAIVGILAAILFPTIGKIRESAAKSVCAGNLHQIAIATLAYAGDHKGALPPHAGQFPFPHSMVSRRPDPQTPSEWDHLRPYVGDGSKAGLLYCPGALLDWRGPDNPNNPEYAAVDGNYITYSYFGYIALGTAARTAFGLDGSVLNNARAVPAGFGLWTCLTYGNGGRYHGHADPDTTEMVKGQNVAFGDGSVRWVKGENLIPYSSVDSTFYGPRPRG